MQGKKGLFHNFHTGFGRARQSQVVSNEGGDPIAEAMGEKAAESRKRFLTEPFSRGADERSESARRERSGEAAAGRIPVEIVKEAEKRPQDYRDLEGEK